MTKKNAKLRDRMKKKRYTQGKIAEKLDIDSGTMSLKMRGECQFKWNEIVKICAILDIKNPIGWFE